MSLFHVPFWIQIFDLWVSFMSRGWENSWVIMLALFWSTMIQIMTRLLGPRQPPGHFVLRVSSRRLEVIILSETLIHTGCIRLLVVQFGFERSFAVDILCWGGGLALLRQKANYVGLFSFPPMLLMWRLMKIVILLRDIVVITVFWKGIYRRVDALGFDSTATWCLVSPMVSHEWF